MTESKKRKLLDEIIGKIKKKSLSDEDKSFSKIKNLHKYWSRKPLSIVIQLIEKYSKPDSLVLDPFCGSGIVGLGSISLGRNFVGYDLNPIAINITEMSLKTDFDEGEIGEYFLLMSKELKQMIMDLYKHNDLFILYKIKKEEYNVILSNYEYKNKQKGNITEETKQDFKYDELNIPDQDFPSKFYKDRFSYKGVKKVSDLFTNRNLKALSIIYNYILKQKKYQDLFFLALSNTLLHVSKLKSENIRPLGVNNYRIPDDRIEENVWWRFEERFKKVFEAKQALAKKLKTTKKIGKWDLFCKSSIELDEIKDISIDYIFTDPPYGEAIQYSELSFVWNTWLGKSMDIKNELIINPVQNKGIKYFLEQMDIFLSNAYKKLKKGGYITMCFHNKDINIWYNLINLLKENGFNLVDFEIYNFVGNTYNNNWAKFSPKSDFYITLSKDNDQVNKLKNTNISKNIYEYFNEVFEYIKELKGELDYSILYDAVVGFILYDVFNETQHITGIDKFNLSKISDLFHQKKTNGNMNGRLF